MKKKINWIREENYAEHMKQEAEPYTAARRTFGFDERVMGEPIYYEHYGADHSVGAIVISHGFTESVAKYTESIYYMLQSGFDVWAVDHRGHGRSFRETENPYVVYVGDFHDYVLDLVHFVEEKVEPAMAGLPVFLYAHSMGGCIGAWVLEENPELFRRAVLSSPMLGLTFGRIPVPVLYAVMSIKGFGERQKNPVNPVGEFTEEIYFENACSSSECRCRYYFEKCRADVSLQTFAPSIGWGLKAVRACAHVCAPKETKKIAVPVLLMQAGNDTVVDNRAQDLFVSRVGNCGKYAVPGMKHELFMTDSDVLIPYWKRVLGFFLEDMA